MSNNDKRNEPEDRNAYIPKLQSKLESKGLLEQGYQKGVWDLQTDRAYKAFCEGQGLSTGVSRTQPLNEEGVPKELWDDKVSAKQDKETAKQERKATKDEAKQEKKVASDEKKATKDEVKQEKEAAKEETKHQKAADKDTATLDTKNDAREASFKKNTPGA